MLPRLVRRLLPLLFLVGLGWFLWKKIGPTLAGLNPLTAEPRVTVTHNTVLTQVEALGRLELVRYRFRDVVEYRRASRYPLLPDVKVAQPQALKQRVEHVAQIVAGFKVSAVHDVGCVGQVTGTVVGWVGAVKLLQEGQLHQHPQPRQ